MFEHHITVKSGSAAYNGAELKTTELLLHEKLLIETLNAKTSGVLKYANCRYG